MIVVSLNSPEEELSVEVGEINGIHVNHMQLREPQQSLQGTSRYVIFASTYPHNHMMHVAQLDNSITSSSCQ